jgi:hypothetical protein
MESPAEPFGLPGLMTPVAEGFGGGSFGKAPPSAGLFVGRAGAPAVSTNKPGCPAGADCMKAKIQSIAAMEILDSRGNPPVRGRLALDNGGAEG